MTVKEMYKVVMFDLDGTLVDSSEGILNAAKEAISRMKMDPPSDDEIRSCIGPPVGETLESIRGWSGYQKKEFYSIFHPIYKDKYVFQCELYPGMMQLLNELNEKGMFIGIATNKRKDSTESLLQYLKIDRMFDTVIAQDQNDIRNKADMILDALKELQTVKEEAVMIGDTVGDLDAARNAGVDFIGVRYGFGFKEKIEDDIKLADSVDELKRLLLQ